MGLRSGGTSTGGGNSAPRPPPESDPVLSPPVDVWPIVSLRTSGASPPLSLSLLAGFARASRYQFCRKENEHGSHHTAFNDTHQHRPENRKRSANSPQSRRYRRRQDDCSSRSLEQHRASRSR